MTYLTSIILGLVQGIAEFLPISSSGHLSLMQHFMNLANPEDYLLFDVLLHLGTLVAVAVVYWRDIVDMVVDFVHLIQGLFRRRREGGESPEGEKTASLRLILMLIVATLPLFVVIPIKSHVEKLYGNTIFIGCALLVTGLVLFLSDRARQGRKTARTATMLDALIVGVGQAFAIVPGLSRSGSTISVGLMRGFERKFAVRFSFLLSIPAILGANILSISDAVAEGLPAGMLPVYLVGMAVAAVAGFAAIKLVNMLAQKGKFGKFAYYCWAVGLVAIVSTLIFH